MLQEVLMSLPHNYMTLANLSLSLVTEVLLLQNFGSKNNSLI